MSILSKPISRRSLALLAALGLAAAASAAQAADKTITIAYQTGFSPWTLAVASGEIEKIPGWHVEFKRFNSGAEVFAAIVVTAVLSLLLFGLVSLIERIALPWYHGAALRRA